MSSEIEYVLYSDRRGGNRSTRKFKRIIVLLVVLLLFSFTISFASIKKVNNSGINNKANNNNKVNNNNNSSNNNNSYNNNSKYMNNNSDDSPVEGFVYLYTNKTKGPITTSREYDNGTKYNVYSMILKNNEEDFNSFYYDKKELTGLSSYIKTQEKYICETNLPLEGKETYITCPLHYTLRITKSFFGRYANDKDNCSVNYKGEVLPVANLLTETDCGKDTKEYVKKMCEGKRECLLRAIRKVFSDPCPGYYKYLHVNYHCIRDSEIRKPKFAVVMFSDVIRPNSIYENAISEFYQYSDIHGYTFILNTNRYDDEREVFYMKLHVVTEAIIRGLKDKEYDWVFWVDGDVMLANPNIKLETFIPNDNKINFIAAADRHGLNAGVFLIKVNSWSLNFMMRSIAYQYNDLDKPLQFADQTSMNNVLLESNEEDHYVIVPQHWFNVYPDKRRRGDMLLHFAGRKNKEVDLKETRDELAKDPGYTSAITNKQLRKEVLEFYELPKSEQGKIWIDE